jgi:hypothetical protein
MDEIINHVSIYPLDVSNLLSQLSEAVQDIDYYTTGQN